MSYLIWPTSLGEPNKEGYGVTEGTGEKSTPVEAGLPRLRQRYTLAADKITVTYSWSRDQRNDYLAFRSQLRAAGGGFFLWPDPLADGWTLTGDDATPLFDEDGNPLLVDAWRIVAFDPQSPPQLSLRGNRLQVTISFISMP